jgi:hypothetical protein
MGQGLRYEACWVRAEKEEEETGKHDACSVKG